MKLALIILASLLPFSCAPAKAAEIKSCVAIKAMEPRLPEGVQRAWGQTTKFWPQKSTLRVRFLSGTSSQRAGAWRRFNQIDSLVNLAFVYVTEGASEVRVRFDAGMGHWSYLGTDCRAIPQSAQTMNLELTAGFFGDSTEEWDRVVFHEMLHSLGFEHEHQSPNATGLVWNKSAVYAYYGRTQGWSRSQIDFQVLNRYTGGNFRGTAFDKTSIMCYPISRGLANIVVDWNPKLSATDIGFLKKVYP